MNIYTIFAKDIFAHNSINLSEMLTINNYKKSGKNMFQTGKPYIHQADVFGEMVQDNIITF